jgi:hypothetical protein
MLKIRQNENLNTKHLLVFLLFVFLLISLFLGVQSQTDDVEQTVVIDASPPSITELIVSNTSGGYDVASFIPIESTNTTVYVIGTALDYDGCSTIDSAANFDIVLFRSGVSGDRNCIQDKNDCYPAIEVGNISITGCSGGPDTDLNFEIPVNLAFWADPTDYGSPFAAQNWIASVKLIDDEDDYTTSTDTFELNSLVALDVPGSITYGSVRPGEVSSVRELAFTQTGNRAFNIEQTATGAEMICDGLGSSNIPWSNVEMSLSRYFVFGDGVDLAAKQHASMLELLVPQRFDDANPTIKKAYLRLQVPDTNISGTCSGVSRFTASAN